LLAPLIFQSLVEASSVHGNGGPASKAVAARGRVVRLAQQGSKEARQFG
jgi:hypothetical protein